MEYKRCCFIINTEAGKVEPITEVINELFKDSGYSWLIHELSKGESASELLKKLLPDFDLFAVYGGDGSITEAAASLIGTETPLAIIPGGTANVLAKELQIPQDPREALTLIRDRQFSLKVIDTGLVNGRPFLLRVNLGIMAEMITGVDPALKDKIGQLAYGVSAIKTAVSLEPVTYELLVDDQPFTTAGVSLTVTNSGNMGIGDLQMYPGISMTDGLLDVLLLRDAGIFSIVKAAGSSLLGTETDTIRHWACRKVSIAMTTPQTYLCDDCEANGGPLTIEVVPSSLTLIVPGDVG